MFVFEVRAFTFVQYDHNLHCSLFQEELYSPSPGREHIEVSQSESLFQEMINGLCKAPDKPRRLVELMLRLSDEHLII